MEITPVFALIRILSVILTTSIFFIGCSEDKIIKSINDDKPTLVFFKGTHNVKKKEPVKKEPNKKHEPPPESKKLPKDQLKNKKDRKIDIDAIARENILIDRIRSGGTVTRRNPNYQVDLDREKNWKRFGIQSEYASYPVNMDRVITVDMRLPCTLKVGIKTTVPGKVVCHLSENIHGRSGRKVLIPVGSAVSGRYTAEVKMFSDRVMVSWDRVIMDNGRSIFFSAPMDSADKLGVSGIPGEVDTRAAEKYLAAVGLSLLDVAGNIAIAKNTEHGTTISQVQSGLNDVGQRYLIERAELETIITVPEGQTITLVPQENIWFPESKNAIARTKTLGPDSKFGDY